MIEKCYIFSEWRNDRRVFHEFRSDIATDAQALVIASRIGEEVDRPILVEVVSTDGTAKLLATAKYLPGFGYHAVANTAAESVTECGVLEHQVHPATGGGWTDGQGRVHYRSTVPA
jgi:hypothetical protein